MGWFNLKKENMTLERRIRRLDELVDLLGKQNEAYEICNHKCGHDKLKLEQENNNLRRAIMLDNAHKSKERQAVVVQEAAKFGLQSRRDKDHNS